MVSASLEVDFDSPLYTEAVTPTITVTVADAPPDRLERARAAGEVLIAGPHGRVDLAEAVERLVDGGRGRLLCEGGPKLLAAVAAAGRLDELCLSISPQLRAGDGLRLLDGPQFPTPVRLNLHTLLTEDGFLFARYVVTSSQEQRPARNREQSTSSRGELMGYEVEKTEDEWRAQLSPAEYQVLRKAGTEAAYKGEYTDTETEGVYQLPGLRQ